MRDDRTYLTEPKEYVNSDCTERLPWCSDEEVGIAICRCPVPLNYGIIIPKEYFDENGVATYKCKKCGLIGQLCVGRRFLND